MVGVGEDSAPLVGALSCSGKWRGVLAGSEEQPYLVASLHGVSERLGGLTRRWRFDRMSTVCHPESGDLTASFAEAAKYYGVCVDVCPSRRGWRKGVVEKANHSVAQRWWRTLPDDLSPARAQERLDAWCARTGDARTRIRDGQRVTVGELAATEPLAPLPAVPFPAVIEDTRIVSAQALVSWHGNFYSVPPGHGGQQVTVRCRLGAATLDVITAAGQWWPATTGSPAMPGSSRATASTWPHWRRKSLPPAAPALPGHATAKPATRRQPPRSPRQPPSAATPAGPPPR